MELDLNTNFTRRDSIKEFYPIKTIPLYAGRSFGFYLDPAPILPGQDPPGLWNNLLPFITEGSGGLRLIEPVDADAMDFLRSVKFVFDPLYASLVRVETQPPDTIVR